MKMQEILTYAGIGSFFGAVYGIYNTNLFMSIACMLILVLCINLYYS